MQAENHEWGCVTVKECAAYLAVSVAKVYQLKASGQLAYIKLGKCRRIPWKGVDALIRRSTVLY
jgi:excisionase family DNA binding protein